MDAPNLSFSFSTSPWPPPLHNPVNLFRPTKFLLPKLPPQSHKIRISTITILPLLILLLVFAISPTLDAAETKNPQISYSQYCNHVVPQSSSSPNPLTDPISLSVWRNQFTYLPGRSEAARSRINAPKQVFFMSRAVYKTQHEGVFKFDATMNLGSFRYVGNPGNLTRRGLRLVHYRPPKIPLDSSYIRAGFHDLSLSGFWNSTSGKLCMVGSGRERRYTSLFGVLKLEFPNKSSIFNSFVNGTLEIYNVDGQIVENLMLLGVNLRNYEFQLITEEIEENVFQQFDHLSNVSLGLEGANELCQIIRKAEVIELEYEDDCDSVNCDIFQNGRLNLSLPDRMFFNQVHCWESGFVRYLLNFMSDGVRSNFNPNATLVAEGMWVGEKKRLDMVGCRMFDGKGTVSDCSIRLSLRLPMLYTIRERNFIVGQLWSCRRQNELGYFGKVKFRSGTNKDLKHDGVRYEYSKIENLKQSYAGKMIHGGKGGKFPEVMSRDMEFRMILRSPKGQVVHGYCSPLFVGDKSFLPENVVGEVEAAGPLKHSQNGLVNVSYQLSFQPLDVLNITGLPRFRSVKIFAEGIYDSKTGHLYMIGCMHVPVPYGRFGRNSSLDCEIFVEIQFPPLDAKRGSTINGTIRSARMNTDPLYFEPLQISSLSLYANQVKESIWRMDLEMTMVLVSNTLACIFVGLQLVYVQKHPDILPFISVIMLTVLTLAHMIPLLLNFEALFLSTRNRQNVYLGTDGWIEVNEVLVRVITMVAFLLEFCLLRLTWSAKAKNERGKILWVSEKKVLYLCLPVYFSGGLIAWFAHLASKSHGRTLLMLQAVHEQRQSFWVDLKSFAGLILDGILFPQIMFNVFCDSKERAFTPAFYVGTTFVRLLPHVYDLYRAQSSTFSVSMIYGNPKMDYYSTTWDIIICILGLLFASLIFLQQRFGGCCFLPKRFRQNLAYEEVPVVGTDTL